MTADEITNTACNKMYFNQIFTLTYNNYEGKTIMYFKIKLVYFNSTV